MGNKPKIYELRRRSDDSLVVRGTTVEIGAAIGKYSGYVNMLLRGVGRLEDYYIVSPEVTDKLAPGCKYVKNFQVFALREYGNTIIRDSHKRFIKEYIEEFKKFGLEVEIHEKYNSLIAHTK